MWLRGSWGGFCRAEAAQLHADMTIEEGRAKCRKKIRELEIKIKFKDKECCQKKHSAAKYQADEMMGSARVAMSDVLQLEKDIELMTKRLKLFNSVLRTLNDAQDTSETVLFFFQVSKTIKDVLPDMSKVEEARDVLEDAQQSVAELLGKDEEEEEEDLDGDGG